LGFVGADAMGRLLEELTADGVDMDHVLVDPAGTNRSVNLMSSDGRRHIFFDGKSHMTIEPDMEAWQKVLVDATLVHFSIPSWARRLLRPARDAGAVVSVDLQDLRDVDDPYRRDFVDAADVLFLSSANISDPRQCWRRCTDKAGSPSAPWPPGDVPYAPTTATASTVPSTCRRRSSTRTAPATRSPRRCSRRLCWRAARWTKRSAEGDWRSAGAARFAAVVG
jgi:sugar/nucleoside kinase (ribokinase family)